MAGSKDDDVSGQGAQLKSNEPKSDKPKPNAAKMKIPPRPPMTKADHAAAKRMDKMVVKRMRKR